MEIDTQGFGELIQDINSVCNVLPYAEDELLEKSGRKLRKYCKDRTPYREQDKKHIRNSYKLSPVKRSGNTNFIEMTNTAPHFHLIERGHRQISKSGEEIGFVEGIHMVERGTEEFDAQFPTEVEKMIDNMLKRVNI
ncbi:HK97 gp10 family phage protein [Clostridium botulinum]|nr:HK97 gp10 family phage protein [Clostridium botulinum]MCS4472349.1 HK97 gp10 family phage protein [Clostridium botulinum]MCS4474850.1 HK97 gp10 family phage protein [Clostridium botulinum]MCS4480672.1 HK97 gp10 family phage protein [Clostridium botulinum]MCS4482745.1 HK97 gp10 family phage protein [Clostridium botulinum]